MEVVLSQTGWTLLMIMLFSIWNASVVLYTVRAIRAKTFSAMKIALFFSTSFGLMVSMFLYTAIRNSQNPTGNPILFALLVFAINVIVGTPVVNFMLKKFMIPKMVR